MFNAVLEAPFGAVGMVVRPRYLELQLLPHALKVGLLKEQDTSIQAPVIQTAVIQTISAQIKAYFAQPNQTFNLPEWQIGTPFQRRVWQAIHAIPCGQVRTYQVLAKQLNSGARAVANACGANPWPILVPCHRVVSKNGLGGFMQGASGGLAIKQWLLQHEGVVLVS